MNKLQMYLMLLFQFIPFGLFAQSKMITLDVVQKDKLEASIEKAIKTDGGFLLGSTLKVVGGALPYTFAWSPDTNLDNATIANPTAGSDEIPIYTVTVKDGRECTCEASVDLRLSDLESIAIEKFLVYPSPATDRLNIYFENGTNQVEIRLLNSTGVLVKTKRFERVSSTIQEINVSDCPRGIYLVQFYMNGKFKTQPIILN